MTVIAVIHHLEHAFLGHAEPALRSRGAELDQRFLRAGDPLPSVSEVDGIVTLGGEQSVLSGELEAEGALLRQAVVSDVPVLGVCLGAQLLARSLGGTVGRLAHRRLWWPELRPLPAAAGDPVLGALPAGAHALHWNEDGFEPPPGAVELLARPDGARAEGFRAGRRAWGVQFHAEVDEEALEVWYRDWSPALEAAGVSEADVRADDARHMAGQAALSAAIFGGFASVVAR